MQTTNGTVPYKFQTGPVQTEWICTIVDPTQNQSEPICSLANVALNQTDKTVYGGNLAPIHHICSKFLEHNSFEALC